LFLDVGNGLRPGVIDHHQLVAAAGSATGLVLNRLDLIDAAVAPGGADAFAVVLHRDPDLDCIASAYLAVAYLTTGALPPGADLLARYVDRVDAGETCLARDRKYTLYAAQRRLLVRPA